MKDKELDRIIREALSYEDEKLMDIVRNEPSLADVKAPDSLKEKLFAQIEEYKEEQARIEEQERIKRLERKYKRAVRWNKAIVIVAALVAMLALGITSMGGPKRVLEEFKRKIGGREQTVIDSEGEVAHDDVQVVTEEEAYEEIEKQFGITPVGMYYIPERLFFSEVIIERETSNARIFYESKDNKTLSYVMLFSYRATSIAKDIEDEVEKEYDISVADKTVHLIKYDVADIERWRVEFVHQEVLYFIEINGVEEKEVKKIVENLHFL